MHTATESTPAVHPFERAGLGLAPFRYVGMVYQEIAYGQRVISINGVEATTKPGGTCDYCGTYIVDMFKVESADGVRFKVGCDCILKVDAVTKIKNIAKFAADRKELKKKRDAAKIADAFARLADPAVRERLAALPHPATDRPGSTLLSYVEWMGKNAGVAGKMRAARLIVTA